MTVFVGQVRSVRKHFYQGEYQYSPIILGLGSIIEILSLPQEEEGGTYVTIKQFGHGEVIKMEWTELELNSEAAEVLTLAKATEFANKIWDNYANGEKTFSHSLSRYYSNYSTLACAAMNSTEKNEANNWNATKEQFVEAFIARAQGLPS